ncbi:MAG: VacJ family lipoprotein [Gammaproteobacteria bacterium]|nr:VacJ family lipoprotein [Gammaproteobacteria bacterium]
MKALRIISILVVTIVTQGCSSSGRTVSHEWNSSSDPFEGANRSVYAFNTTADKYILRPVASGYDKALPEPAKKGVSNFLSNLSEPWNVVNSLLQGKVNRALGSTYRFAVNSTVGLLGLIDVAQGQGVEKTPEDLGQTLAVWGVKPGPYLMLPFLGPTNFRDGLGRSVSPAFYSIRDISNSTSTRIGLTALDIVNTRVGLLAVDEALEKQLDPYLFIKTAFENSRTAAINDGKEIEVDYDF